MDSNIPKINKSNIWTSSQLFNDMVMARFGYGGTGTSTDVYAHDSAFYIKNNQRING